MEEDLGPTGDRVEFYRNPGALILHDSLPRLINCILFSKSNTTPAPLNWVPFKYSNKGFIIKREGNRYMMLARPDGTPYHTVDDEDFKRPGRAKGTKFGVYVHKFWSNHYVLGFYNPLLALNTAWKAQTFRNGHIKKNDVYYMDFDVDHHYKVLKPVVELLEDEDYNRLVCAQQPCVPTFPELSYDDKYPDASCSSEVLYENFKNFLNDTINQSGHINDRWGSKSSTVGSIETMPGEELLLHTAKRNVPFEYVSTCVDVNGFAPLVTRFPKSGCITTSGEIRSIFCMNILYENALRRFFKDKKPKVPFRVAIGREFGKKKKYFYDIKSCDKVLLPYFSRFCQEHDLKWLIPKVVDPLFKHEYESFYIDQFPSGVFHTSLVTVCFTAALCMTLGCYDAVIQGDGFMTDVEVEHESLRQVEDFNGFVYSNGTWIYNRGYRLDEFKYLRGSGPSGVMKYIITRWAYIQLGANLTPDKIVNKCKFIPEHYDESNVACGMCHQQLFNGFHFHQMDDDGQKAYMIGQLYSGLNDVVKTVLREKGVVLADTRKNNWDTFPLELVKVDAKDGLIYERIKVNF